ncbi:MAG: polar amino acid transport system substrate-binding protein [Gammaproteobacteria bacterium]|jgi:polar amino acid transport system substrate-binding protein
MNGLWIVLMVLISPCIFSETISLCSMERPGLSQKDGTGYYWDLLRAIYQTEGIELEHHSAPFKRCLLLVERKRVDGAVAVFHSTERSEKFIYPISRLNFSSYGLTYLKETSLDKIENVNGKVGIVRGYDFSAWLPSNVMLEPLNSNVQAIGMLKLKRIKYHADDLQDVLLTLKKVGERADQFFFKPFHTKNLYVPFTKNARGQKLADAFDKGLRIVSQSGELEKLIEKHGITKAP